MVKVEIIDNRFNQIKTIIIHGKIYGCNGLYRDFKPDVLVSELDNEFFYYNDPYNLKYIKVVMMVSYG